MATDNATIAKLTDELIAAYTAASLVCGDGLLPPASEADILSVGTELQMPIPKELHELWRLHGGQKYIGAGITGLFGQHRILSPFEAVEHHQMFRENCLQDPRPEFPPEPTDWGYWVPELIPFASWDAYDLCVHTTSGDIWEFEPYTGLTAYRPNIRSILIEAIASAKQGAKLELPSLSTKPGELR